MQRNHPQPIRLELFLWQHISGKFEIRRVGKWPGFSSNSDRTAKKLFQEPKHSRVWLSVWYKWCKQKNIVNKIEENEAEKLNKLLETFYAEVKKTKTVTTTSQAA